MNIVDTSIFQPFKGCAELTLRDLSAQVRMPLSDDVIFLALKPDGKRNGSVVSELVYPHDDRMKAEPYIALLLSLGMRTLHSNAPVLTGQWSRFLVAEGLVLRRLNNLLRSIGIVPDNLKLDVGIEDTPKVGHLRSRRS